MTRAVVIDGPQEAPAGRKADQLCAQIRRDILEGRLKQGSPLPTQTELGRKYGVAATTASMAMSRLAHEGLVIRIPGRGSFVSQEMPQSARSIHFIRSVGSPDRPPNSTDLKMTDIFANLVQKRGYVGVWHHLPKTLLNQPDAVIDRFHGARRAVLKHCPDVFAEALAREGVSVVTLFSGTQRPATYPQLDMDRAACSQRAIDYLVSLGHRRIAYVSRGDKPEWMRGFIRGAVSHGLPTPVTWIVEGKDYYLNDSAERVRAMLRSEPRPEAFVCPTVHEAALLESLVLGVGLRIPEDIAIVAADSGPEAETATIPVTTVGVDLEDVCQQAIDLVELPARWFRSDETLQSPTILPTNLYVRQSCGARLRGLVSLQDNTLSPTEDDTDDS
jgi:GntR family transcriptional regulator, arabinose operon transcriptional repressor